MAEPRDPKKNPDAKISGQPASAEDLRTLDGPVKASVKPGQPPNKPPSVKPPDPSSVPESLNTLDSAVALKTPVTGTARANQTPFPTGDGTAFGGGTFDGTSTPLSNSED